MGKKRRSKTPAPKAPAEQPGGGFGGLGDMLAAQGLETATPAKPARGGPKSKAAHVPSPPAADGLSGKAVVRRERKGRGGKTVTVVSGAALTGQDLPALAKRMRKALGTGARIEDGAIVVQGDQRDAAAKWLGARGAKVVLGN
ncbi:MAG: translation initiation factor [Deltaproteobacteria bacterium]|nr:translation initiation factor [Deltaproteobacteria bacterium]